MLYNPYTNTVVDEYQFSSSGAIDSNVLFKNNILEFEYYTGSSYKYVELPVSSSGFSGNNIEKTTLPYSTAGSDHSGIEYMYNKIYYNNTIYNDPNKRYFSSYYSNKLRSYNTETNKSTIITTMSNEDIIGLYAPSLDGYVVTNSETNIIEIYVSSNPSSPYKSYTIANYSDHTHSYSMTFDSGSNSMWVVTGGSNGGDIFSLALNTEITETERTSRCPSYNIYDVCI